MNRPQGPSVLFGPEIWNLQQQGGVSRHVKELINNMVLINNSVKAVIPETNNVYAQEISNQIKISTDQFDNFVNKPDFDGIFKGNENIYHATYFSEVSLSAMKRRGFHVVVTVYDMISELFPDRPPLFRRRNNEKERVIQIADHIVCVSQTSANDLARIFGVSNEKISITYPGTSFGGFTKQIDNNLLGINPFLLYVGNRNKYKNFKRLIMALSGSKIFISDFKLVAFGGGTFSKSEIAFLKELGMWAHVIHVEGNDSKLFDYYSCAKSLIYPSIYEGFGLPPIEAMASGCPAIVSSGGSIPEVCGDAAVYFDPYNLHDIRNVIEETIQNDELLSNLSKFGRIHALEFSWENTAVTTLGAYDKLISDQNEKK
jgi:glycosyltransferase involved in cell wall biosynthesis